MKSYKILWTVIACLTASLVVIGYKFMHGNVVPSDDGRIAVGLSKYERNVVLAEMRKFLVTIQAVSEAISNQDMKLVAKLATESGMQSDKNTPSSLLAKIPVSMKTVGFDTHKKFDQIALDAERLNDPKHSRNQLDELMKNCIACHASFKLVEVNN